MVMMDMVVVTIMFAAIVIVMDFEHCHGMVMAMDGAYNSH